MSSILPHADRSRFRGANPAHTAIHCYPMRPSRSGNSESSLPAGLESVNRRIATLSKRKTDPLHNKIMDFAAFLEGGLASSDLRSESAAIRRLTL